MPDMIGAQAGDGQPGVFDRIGVGGQPMLEPGVLAHLGMELQRQHMLADRERLLVRRRPR